VGELDRAECRRDVERRFSAQRMVADYGRLYREAVARHSSGSTARAG
jgi:hypothetical protein